MVPRRSRLVAGALFVIGAGALAYMLYFVKNREPWMILAFGLLAIGGATGVCEDFIVSSWRDRRDNS